MEEECALFDNCVFIDIETTGLNYRYDEIVEIGALKIVKGKIDGEYSTLIKPFRPISYWITKINGISNNMLKDAPQLKEVAQDFLRFIKGMPVVAHNADFDLAFLKNHIESVIETKFAPEYVDTLYVARKLFPNVKSNSLEALSKRLNVNYEGAHRALKDCHITYQCVNFLKEYLKDCPVNIVKIAKYGISLNTKMVGAKEFINTRENTATSKEIIQSRLF